MKFPCSPQIKPADQHSDLTTSLWERQKNMLNYTTEMQHQNSISRKL